MIQNEPSYSDAVHEASENLALLDELLPLERAGALELHRAVEEVKGLPRLHPPPGFAERTAADITLKNRLEAARVAAPPDLAAVVSARIHSDAALRVPLTVRAPEDFAATLAKRINDDAEALPRVTALPRVAAPVGFAQSVSSLISHDASSLPELTALPRVVAPPQFAHNLALRIASDALGDETEAHDRAPLYFIGALLAGVAVALIALTWPYASVAGTALFETLRVLPEPILAPVLAVAVLAALGAAATRRARLPAALGAFAVAAGLVVPQALPFFGSTQVAGSAYLGSIVRFAGDITVSGEVRGDVIAVGGNVRLTPGARVSGRVLTFLGDVNLPGSAETSGVVSAVLGKLNVGAPTAARTQSVSLPGLSAASALQPLRMLITAGTWHWWYLGLLLALAGALLMSPGLRHTLERPLWFEAGRAIGLGLLLLFLTVPAVALGGLSLIGAPFALLIGVFTLLAFSSGVAMALAQLGQFVLASLGWRRAGLWRLLPGFGLFALALLYAPLAITLWLLLGAWGAGALLMALRQGRLWTLEV